MRDELLPSLSPKEEDERQLMLWRSEVVGKKLFEYDQLKESEKKHGLSSAEIGELEQLRQQIHSWYKRLLGADHPTTAQYSKR